MNDDELKKLWQQQPLRSPEISPAQVISAMQKQTTLLRRVLDARDLRELWACAFVIVIFGIFYFTVYRTPISRLGDLIVIGSAIFIAFKLVYTRRSTPPARPGATIVESLRSELNSVRSQSQLLGSILWWYLLPLGIGILVCTWGSPGGLAPKIAYTVFVTALYAFIYRLNQQARSKQLLPVEAQLESLIHSAETGEPLDETHVANLRPIVVSMAAAERVKSVEFKIDFWQLALYAEIGFVGIWFFSMLSSIVDNAGGKIKQPALQTVAQSVRPEETNRYSPVARKVVHLLNTGDHAGVQKLFNSEMSLALPPQKASEFFTGLPTKFGNIQKFEGPIGYGYRGWIAFRLHCQRGDLTMSLALDAEDKIAGIHFLPDPRLSEMRGSLMHQLFSWPHLVWLVALFLAGLLFSWLLQKMTERAVGISALGVHFHRGLTLILWDEIKEVRPFRLLNIRSLWLIRESGEKMIMPWTGLERHSDLRAAVEAYAPENHPMRKYLSLLKRIQSK
jgi:hypothetical protein